MEGPEISSMTPDELNALVRAAQLAGAGSLPDLIFCGECGDNLRNLSFDYSGDCNQCQRLVAQAKEPRQTNYSATERPEFSNR